jgi:hypothetical protein
MVIDGGGAPFVKEMHFSSFHVVQSLSGSLAEVP